MVKLTGDKIAAALPSLDKEELTKERAALDFLGVEPSTNPSSPTHSDPLEENFILFYGCLKDIFQNYGITVPKEPQFLPKKSLSKLHHGWYAVEDYIDLNFEGQMRKTQRVKLYIVILHVVIDYLNEIELPLSVKTLSEQLWGNCSGLMGRQFPGYSAAGLMSVALKWGQMDDRTKD